MAWVKQPHHRLLFIFNKRYWILIQNSCICEVSRFFLCFKANSTLFRHLTNTNTTYIATKSMKERKKKILRLVAIAQTYYHPGEGIHLINNDDLRHLVRNLALTKGQAELLGSRLKEFNLLSSDIRTSQFQNKHKELVQFFAISDNMCYCSDIQGLMLSFEVEHSTEAWRLFIDSSKASLNSVLLHNGNMYASVPVGCSVHLKETYETMLLLLEKNRYRDYNWNIYGDIKVITIFMGMQTRYTKYSCFICQWISRDSNRPLYKVELAH